MTSATTAEPASGEDFAPDHQHWLDRFINAEGQLRSAHEFVITAADERRITASQRNTYCQLIDHAHARAIDEQLAGPANIGRPGYPGAERLTPKARAQAAEAACAAVRDKAIVLYRDEDICEDARDEFLSFAGLEAYEGDD